MKLYNAIKNLIIAGMTATFYWQGIIESATMLQKVYATAMIMFATYLMLRGIDKEVVCAIRKRRQRKVEENA